jgi:hypothetical protein
MGIRVDAERLGKKKKKKKQPRRRALVASLAFPGLLRNNTPSLLISARSNENEGSFKIRMTPEAKRRL